MNVKKLIRDTILDYGFDYCSSKLLSCHLETRNEEDEYADQEDDESNLIKQPPPLLFEANSSITIKYTQMISHYDLLCTLLDTILDKCNQGREPLSLDESRIIFSLWEQRII